MSLTVEHRPVAEAGGIWRLEDPLLLQHGIGEVGTESRKDRGGAEVVLSYDMHHAARPLTKKSAGLP